MTKRQTYLQSLSFGSAWAFVRTKASRLGGANNDGAFKALAIGRLDPAGTNAGRRKFPPERLGFPLTAL
jgi:hypothetical protein